MQVQPHLQENQQSNSSHRNAGASKSHLHGQERNEKLPQLKQRCIHGEQKGASKKQQSRRADQITGTGRKRGQGTPVNVTYAAGTALEAPWLRTVVPSILVSATASPSSLIITPFAAVWDTSHAIFCVHRGQGSQTTRRQEITDRKDNMSNRASQEDIRRKKRCLCSSPQAAGGAASGAIG